MFAFKSSKIPVILHFYSIIMFHCGHTGVVHDFPVNIKPAQNILYAVSTEAEATTVNTAKYYSKLCSL